MPTVELFNTKNNYPVSPVFHGRAGLFAFTNMFHSNGKLTQTRVYKSRDQHDSDLIQKSILPK